MPENLGKEQLNRDPLNNDQLKEFVFNLGADEFGVADLAPVREHLLREYGEVWEDYPFAVSIGAHLPFDVVEQLTDGPTRPYLTCYDTLNARLNDIALRLSAKLAKSGYRAFPIPASQRMGEDKLAAIFSHRMAARLAGLGWIGKSANLINPQAGPCLRLSTVLTDAPLLPDRPAKGGCGSCTACKDICPANAIKGNEFDPAVGVSGLLDVFACDEYLGEIRHVFGKRICGRCLAACPFGKRRR